MKKLLSIFSLTLLISMALAAPVLAASTTQSVYSGWVKSGELMPVGGCFLNITVSGTGIVHLYISSPSFPSANVSINKGHTYYYYDTIHVYIADVDTVNGRTMVDISKPVASGDDYSGTTLTCDIPGQLALGGDVVTFPLVIKNDNEDDKTYTLSSSSAAGWSTGFKFGENSIYKLYVPAGQSRTVSLIVETSSDSAIGESKVTAKADDLSIDLYVYVTSVNRTSEVSAKVSSKIASIGEKVQYEVLIKNLQSVEKNYALSVTGLPDNWYYRFKETAASTDEMAVAIVPADTTKSIILEIVPAYSVSEGDYNFTAKIVPEGGSVISTGLNLKLKSSVDMSVTSSKLAYETKAGGTFTIDIYVSNDGSGGTLTNVGLDMTAPDGWLITTSPETVNSIKAGESQKFTVSVQAPGNIAASDYEVDAKISSDQAVEEKTYRVTIYAESYIPYLGAGIIVLVLIGLVVVYRKYGRR